MWRLRHWCKCWLNTLAQVECESLGDIVGNVVAEPLVDTLV